MEFFQRNFKGLLFLCFADVTRRLERRNEASSSRAKFQFPPQNTGMKTSIASQSFSLMAEASKLESNPAA